VVYTWNFAPPLIEVALSKGASGYLSKTLPASALVDALERIHGGEVVVSPPPPRTCLSVGQNWPGRSEGLSERESEILALITQGKNNQEIAALTYLSANSVKTYIRSTYRKIGVQSRTQAVLWGVEHGFTPDHRRIDLWRRDAVG
jgi:DNA-binding NarL/FixJ family response regulator